jgi:alanine dehydrogenase
MQIGIPKETKADEHRVALTPAGVAQLCQHQHSVWIESNAGAGSGFSDDQYLAAGATLVPTAADAWAAPFVVKVKEPQPSEYQFLRSGLSLFTYLHLAAAPALTDALLRSGTTAIAYETVESQGRLPLLTPMSEVAGRIAVQVGAHYLEKTNGGRGMLLGGVAGVAPSQVVILGGGVVGANAAQIALGMGACVTILDNNTERLRFLEQVLHGRLCTLAATPAQIADSVRQADLVIGSVLIRGARAPRLVTRAMVASMQPGSVVIDVAVDQGGCIETTRVTTHSAPTFLVDGVLHYGVANMPGAVPRTSSQALSNATLPYIQQFADNGLAALRNDTGFALGLNTHQGLLTCSPVATAFGLPVVAAATALG